MSPTPRAASSSPLVSDAGPAAAPNGKRKGEDPPLEPQAELGDGPGRELVYDPDQVGELEPETFWEERQVRALLVPTGIGANKLIGAGHPEAFKFTEDDLQAIAPGLTNYLNRFPITRAAARAGDEAALFVAFGQYGVRSVRQRGQHLALLAELEADPNLEREQGLADATIPEGFRS